MDLREGEGQEAFLIRQLRFYNKTCVLISMLGPIPKQLRPINVSYTNIHFSDSEFGTNRSFHNVGKATGRRNPCLHQQSHQRQKISRFCLGIHPLR